MFLAVSISHPLPPFIKHCDKRATTSQGTPVTDLALGYDNLAPWTPGNPGPDPAWAVVESARFLHCV